MRVLEANYGYSLQDYYTLTGETALDIPDQNPATKALSVPAMQSRLDSLEKAYDSISRSTIWKLTKPVRTVIDFLKSRRSPNGSRKK